MRLPEDRGLTAVQAFIRAEARKLRHLFCSVCRLEPPRHPGGPCAQCEVELGHGG